jgi:hypothetical protein
MTDAVGEPSSSAYGMRPREGLGAAFELVMKADADGLAGPGD